MTTEKVMLEKNSLSTVVKLMIEEAMPRGLTGGVDCFNVKVPLQGAFWVSSPFSVEGVSSSSLVGIESGYLYVYAPIKMSALTKPVKFAAVIGLPLHAGESTTKAHHLIMALQVEFDSFLFNEKNTRFAKLKVLYTDAGQQEYMRCEVKPVLDARDRVYGEFELESVLGLR
jgi:hypothetical protein